MCPRFRRLLKLPLVVEHGARISRCFLEEIAIFISKTANRLEIDTDAFLFRQTM
jgi:hypothetical protein